MRYAAALGACSANRQKAGRQRKPQLKRRAKKQSRATACASARVSKEYKTMNAEDIAMNEYLKDLRERQIEYMEMMLEEDWLEYGEEE